MERKSANKLQDQDTSRVIPGYSVLGVGRTPESPVRADLASNGENRLASIDIDSWRSFVFPNNIRELRKARGLGSLLQLSERLPKVTYIRLSKIERGEVFARARELREIAQVLEVDAEDLLVDIDTDGFDIAEWATRIVGPDPVNPKADHMAVLIAAAVRARRAADPELTIAAIEDDYGIAPVILSRIENAQKPFERWNEDIRSGMRRLLGTQDDADTFLQVGKAYAEGEFDLILPQIATPSIRIEKTRERVAALRHELAKALVPTNAPQLQEDAHGSLDAAPLPHVTEADATPDTKVLPRKDDTPRFIPVFGSPLPEGLIAHHPTGSFVEAPASAGPRSYGLRICRPSLGPGMPGRATLIVDPDRFPASGGLGVIKYEDGSLRAVSITVDRQGRTIGFGQLPDYEVVIDDLAPDQVASVVAAIFE